MTEPSSWRPRYWDPSASTEARLEDWYSIARSTVSRAVCESLYRFGFEDLAVELMRQRGEDL